MDSNEERKEQISHKYKEALLVVGMLRSVMQGVEEYLRDLNSLLGTNLKVGEYHKNGEVECFDDVLDKHYLCELNESVKDVMISSTDYLGNSQQPYLVKLKYPLLSDILKERARQDSLWGEQNHSPEFWVGILGEEYGELCEAVNETVFDNGSNKGGYENMKREATQVAAVALSFLECLERNRSKWFGGNDGRFENNQDLPED